ncbi:MAG: GAF domain-containing protein [Candidatus Eisenbacteria bacterium]|uniref:histidine kinase n=1 Tax=Eiseniibacteriota bacterium TaxID=2212470 RepID=A0A9D6L9L1_UNCEI|nr:GAF domain-containing protein [Candidatus Eisenbacteria bacterium]
MESSPGTGREAVPARDCGAIALATQPPDLAALERMLIAWAVHPHGAKFARASLYAWSPVRHTLVVRFGAADEGGGADLDAALTRAAHAAGDAADPDRARRTGPAEWMPERLEGASARAWADGVAIDAHASPGAEEPASGETIDRACGAVRLTHDGAPCLLIVGGWRDAGNGEDRHAALATLRRIGEAALAAERGRSDAARHARAVASLAEFAAAAVSPLNLAEVLDLAGRLATGTCEARGGAVWLGDTAPDLELESTQGPPGTRERLARALMPLAMEVVEEGRPRVIPDDGPGGLRGDGSPVDSALIVPVTAYGAVRGVLAVYDRLASHPSRPPGFDPADAAFVTALAHQLALAVDQARRIEAVRQAEQRCDDLRRELARRERLAALGEMAARVAHEVRNPLASIGAFARRAYRQLAAEDPGREYLEIVIREAERLEGMVGEQLQYATLERPRLKLESVNNVVQEALQAAGERLVRRRVRLLKRLSPDLPPLLLDTERIGRVVGNILEHALDAVAPGGRLRVESRRAGAFAVVEIAHDGQRHPGELLDQLFVPFAISRQGGSGVGLAVAQQVLKQHGGEIRVRGEGEWSSVFSFTLPIPENDDRRRPGRERRASRADRRARAGG